MRTSKRISNLSELKKSDVVYLVRKGKKEAEAFEVVTTFPGRLSAFTIVKSMSTGMKMVMRPLGPGEYIYMVEEREEIAC